MLHLIDEEPISVSAVGKNHFGPMEDMAYMSVHFSNSILAHFHVNWLSPVKIRRILIGGTKHMLVYDDMEPSEKVKIYDKGIDIKNEESVYRTLVQYRVGDMHAPQVDQTEALALMTADFVHCTRSGKKPLSNGVFGRDVVRILEAANASLKDSGKNVTL
jgi:predicted dehydrogenase